MKANKLFIIIRQYEIILASGICLVIVFILANIFLLPNFNRAQEIFREQQGSKKKIALLTSKDNFLSTLDFKFYKETYPKLAQILPEEKDYVSLFSAFDELEQKTGVIILRTDFQLGAVSTTSAKLTRHKGSLAYTVPLRVEVFGDISSLKIFFENLNRFSGRLITIESITWDIKEGGYVQAVLAGYAFFYPPPSTLASIDSSLQKIQKSQEELLRSIAQMEVVPKVEKETEKVRTGKRNLFE